MSVTVIGTGTKLNMDDLEKDKARKYLLGIASPDERSWVEARLGDDQYYEEFTLVEDDLIDDYLLGLLSEAELKGFTHHFLGSPEHREKVRHFEAVATLVSNPDAVDMKRTHFWQYSRPFWRVALPLGAIAGAVLVMSFLLVAPLKREVRRLMGEKESVETRAERLEKDLETARSEAANSNERSQALERARHRVAELENQLAQQKPDPAVTFTSSRERASTTPRTLSIRRDARDVKVHLFLPNSVKSSSYRASLTQGDDVLWLEDRLKARPAGGRLLVELHLPVQAFNDGRYVLTIEAKTGDGYEKIDAYPLKVRMR
jgi:hypothetical protein